jgi:hypothetical protein
MDFQMHSRDRQIMQIQQLHEEGYEIGRNPDAHRKIVNWPKFVSSTAEADWPGMLD